MPSKFEQVVASYREDHTHPVNHFLHLFVGWPMVAAAILVLPFQLWWWSLGLFVGGYAFMWFGHFVFEHNLPTIFKHPATPFIMARAVVQQIVTTLLRPFRGRQPLGPAGPSK